MHEFDHLLHYIEPLLPLSTTLHPGGKLKEKIRCLLFDIYGTLFISGSGDISIARRQSRQTRYLKKLLETYHIKTKPQTLLNDFFSAIDNEHKILKDVGVDFPEVEIEKIWANVLKFEDVGAARSFAVALFPMRSFLPHICFTGFLIPNRNSSDSILNLSFTRIKPVMQSRRPLCLNAPPRTSNI